MSQKLVWVFGGGTLVAGAAVATFLATGLREDDAMPPAPAPLVSLSPGTIPAAQTEPTQGSTPEAATAVAPAIDAPASEPVAPVIAATPPPPLFDVVRIARDGGALVAGEAMPGAAITLRVDGVVVAQTSADGAGQFVSLFSLGHSDAAQMMTLEMEMAGGTVIASEDTVILTPRPAPAPVLIAEAAPDGAPATPVVMPDSAGSPADVAEPTPEPVVVAQAPAQALDQPAGTAPAQSDIQSDVQTDVAISTPTVSTSPLAAPVPEPAPVVVAQAPVSAVEPTTAAGDGVEDTTPVTVAVAETPQVAPVADASAEGITQADNTQGDSTHIASLSTAPAPVSPQEDIAVSTRSAVSAPELIAQEILPDTTVDLSQPTVPSAADTATQLATVAPMEAPEGVPTTPIETAASVVDPQPAPVVVADAGDASEPVVSAAATQAALAPVSPEPTQIAAAQTGDASDPATITATQGAPAASVSAQPAATIAADAGVVPQPTPSTDARTHAVIEPAAPVVASSEPVQSVAITSDPTAARPAQVAVSTPEPSLPSSPDLSADPVTELLAQAEPMPTAFLVRGSGEVEVLDRAPQVMDNVVIDSISYSAQGDVQIAGRSASALPTSNLRIYLNNEPIAVVRSERGDWASDLPHVDPGVYTLRVDQLSDAGQVVSRFETPFQREDPDRVAAAQSQTTVAAPTAVASATQAAPMVTASAPEAVQDLATRAPTAADPAPAPVPPVSLITVQPGHTLWAISNERYGAGELYVVIYRANRNQIRDPDLIYPGQVFALPDN